MAGLYIRRNPLFGGKNELAKALSKKNSTLSHFLIISWAQTLDPAWLVTSRPALAFALSSLKRYINKNLQRTIKLALELFVKGQKHDQL